MRSMEVGKARVEIDFKSQGNEGVPVELQIVRTMYFEGSVQEEHQICDSQRLSQFKNSGLESQVTRFAIDAVQYTRVQNKSDEVQTYMAIVEMYQREDLESGIVELAPELPGLTPILRAALMGDEVQIRESILKHENVNAYTAEGITPLIYAIVRGKQDTIKMLLAAGADINENALSSGTALMAAVGNDRPEILKLLLESGADPNIYDSNGETALGIAIKDRRTKCIDILRAAHASR